MSDNPRRVPKRYPVVQRTEAFVILTKECGHEGAWIRNCPYSADVNNNSEQRCKCCNNCARECAMDI